MDARTPSDSSAPSPDGVRVGAGERLRGYGRAKRRRERRRQVIRGAVVVAVVVVVWQLMAVAYNLQQVLAARLSAARSLFNPLALNYEQGWLYGLNV